MSPPVIHVAQLVTTLAVGGAQATVLDSLEPPEPTDSDQPRIEMTVLAGGVGRSGTEPTLWNDSRLPTDAIEVPRLVRRISPIDDLLALCWLVGWLRQNRPDVLHTHSSKAGVLGRLAASICRIRCVHTVHGWGPVVGRRGAAGIAMRTLERLLAILCSTLVVVGQGDLKLGLKHRIGRPEQYRVIRSGVDISTGARAAAERDQVRTDLLGQRSDSEPFIVGMVARMAPQKDHATLIEAFRLANIPGSRLVLIGDGPTRLEVEQAIDTGGLRERVHLLGSRDDAARLVAGFDVAVLSSRWEGMPRSLVEAAAARVPILACRVGSVEDLIEHEVSGLWVEPGDVPAMADALAKMHTDLSTHQQMADTANTRAAEFSVEKMRQDLAELWLDVAGVPRPNPSAGEHQAQRTARRPVPRSRSRSLLRARPGS